MNLGRIVKTFYLFIQIVQNEQHDSINVPEPSWNACDLLHCGPRQSLREQEELKLGEVVQVVLKIMASELLYGNKKYKCKKWTKGIGNAENTKKCTKKSTCSTILQVLALTKRAKMNVLHSWATEAMKPVLCCGWQEMLLKRLIARKEER